MKYLLSLFFVYFLYQTPSFAQKNTSDSTSSIFRLGEVTVYGNRNNNDPSVLDRKQLEAFGTMDASRALNLMSGITIRNVGARNEAMVSVRGFDLRQVPLFIDGIPVYVPYDGYVDLARFTVFDLSQINVSKGFSSITYGANTMGGAINLVSRRPTKKLEYDGRAGWMSGDGYRLNLNLGANLGKFYVQGGISQLKQESYPLSAKYETKTLEDGGNRENAFRDDVKYSIKVGYTPNSTDEYAVSYVLQNGSKGTPPYVGNDPLQRARFWQWPYWNKESLYFISNTSLSSKSYLKSRLFLDNFDNALYAYDDPKYTTQTRASSFQSFYDDQTLGGSLEYGSQLSKAHLLKSYIQIKNDDHKENNLNEPVRSFIDNTFSAGFEDVFQVNKKLTLLPGISYNARNNSQADNYNATDKSISPFAASKNNAWNLQIASVYELTNNMRFNASIAQKTRFATIKDRYSYRMGAAIPNPDLKSETALHYEVGTSVTKNNLSTNISLFYSKLTDVIQQVNNVRPNIFQFQNAGEAEFMGTEFNLNYTIQKHLKTGVQYAYISRKNLSNPELKFTDVPNHKSIVFAQYSFSKKTSLMANFEYNSERYSTSYGIKVPSFTLVNLRGSVQLYKILSMEFGINNLFDKNYSLAEGFPEAGRNYSINLVISNL